MDTSTQSQVPADETAFAVKDCALVSLATGRKAHTLREFNRWLKSVSLDSVYHHFWGTLLEPRFEEREYNNDFAAWIRHDVHDAALAEQVAVLDPTGFVELEALRGKIVRLVEARLAETGQGNRGAARRPFVFLRSQIVVFDTGRKLTRPEELARAVPGLSASSIFYHFIDARRRTESGRDDFRDWLDAFGAAYDSMHERIADIDPYFGSLVDLRGRLTSLFASCFSELA